MSATPVVSRKKDRRSYPRRRCEHFNCTHFRPDAGGILVDLSEAGLGFHDVEGLVEGQVIHLKFMLPGTSTDIEADAEIARSNDSMKRVGLRFMDLSEDARHRVRAWVSQETEELAPSDIAKKELSAYTASAAIHTPPLSVADGATKEQAHVSGIAGVPEPKLDEAATPAVSSTVPTALSDAVAAAVNVGQDNIDQTTLDQTNVDQSRSLPTPSATTTPPPTEDAIAMAVLPTAPPIAIANTDAPEAAPAAEPLKLSPLPGGAAEKGEFTFAPDTSVPKPWTQPLRGPQTSGMKNSRSEGMSDMKEKLPTTEQIEQRAYEIYVKRGSQSGNDVSDWIAAERELNLRYRREAVELSSLEHPQGYGVARILVDFYGLQEQPFGVTPDPAYLYASQTHGEALASLLFGIQNNRGFLALIAEPGMGKTTLLYQLLEDLRDYARTVFVYQTQCDSRELLQYILHDLNIDAQGMSLVAMHNKLNDVLFEEMFSRKRFVLVVDEAQNFDESVLETVRMLSNFETHHTKLLQIVLAGQPRLASKLAQPQLSQLRQRIAVLSHLEPFTAAETACYIDHRLKVAGHCGKPLFEPDAVSLIAQRSQGIPRNINNTCYNSLLVSHARGQRTVTSDIVREAVARLDIESRVNTRPRQPAVIY